MYKLKYMEKERRQLWHVEDKVEYKKKKEKKEKKAHCPQSLSA